MKTAELEKYKKKLMGLIPPERIMKVEFPRPSREIIEAFLELDGLTPTVSDVLDSMGIKGSISASRLRPIINGKKIVGPAVTIRYIPESNTTDYGYSNKERAKLADRDVYAIAEKGDVPVFDAASLGDISVMGGLSTLVAKKWGMAGNIVDGGVRDIDNVHKLDYPVWSTGQTPITGKYRVEAMEINGPISIAGVRVNPGDLIIADDSGVVVVPFEKVEEVLEKTIAATRREDEVVRLFESGVTIEELSEILPPSKW
ncbi:RraA family protein [Peribacillus cavernae]|uniref:Putative 4-hydroxy-4-methyl-2-oxoglutarate aldolase n=1 Tax=Peribacillus cavernae TaxID=1674310 RepID=A0A433HFL4_9BACI|nr:RraA family protein [Peribacillus cavernae]MDQ0219495.1 regulator of RNase E activity RraA [Peribacillus cavernae]RUQ27088.1 RraA family protein [Peribacillus cavernae]